MQEKYKQLRTLHLALCVGVAMFLVFASLLKSLGKVPFASSGDAEIFTVIGAVVFIAASIASRMLYTKRLTEIDQSIPGAQKMDEYRGAFILRIATLEGAAILNLLMFLLEGSWWNMGLCVLALLLMILTRPDALTLREALHLSADEQAELSQTL